VHADFPLAIFVEEEGAIKLLPPWEIMFQYEKHYDILSEQMVKGRIESVAVSLPSQTFKDTKEDDDIAADLVPTKVLLPIIAQSIKTNLFESVLSVVTISLDGACKRGCGLSHMVIQGNERDIRHSVAVTKRDKFTFSETCIKHDPSEKNKKFRHCLTFCSSMGCTERAPVTQQQDPMQHRQWLLNHDCEVEGTDYQPPALRELSAEMWEHNETIRASPSATQTLKRAASGDIREQRKAKRQAAVQAKARRSRPPPDTPETGKLVGEKRAMESKTPPPLGAGLPPAAVPLGSGGVSPPNLN